MNKFLGLFFIVNCFLLSSCGTSTVSTNLDFVDVKGTVLLPDGKPLKQGMIQFESTTPGQGRQDQAGVTAGAFTIKMVSGSYKVAFDVESPTTSVAPAKYRKFSTSDVTVDIKGGDITIQLK